MLLTPFLFPSPGPKTIDQIHKEAAQEKKNQQVEHLLNKPLGGGGRDRDRDRDRRDQDQGRKRSQRGGGGGGGMNQNDPEGWSTISK